jgi:hypothetical protein
MVLTYRALVKQPAPTYETREVKVPNHWGMYTPAGNKSLTKKAEKLVAEIEEAKGIVAKLKIFKKYFKGWRSLHNTKTMSESGDTEVRECVWCFAARVARAVDVDEESLDKIWEEVY